MPQNAEVLELWNQISTQWRAGAMGVIGLDYQEVRRWAADLDIDLSPCLWKKIKMLERMALEKQHKKED